MSSNAGGASGMASNHHNHSKRQIPIIGSGGPFGEMSAGSTLVTKDDGT